MGRLLIVAGFAMLGYAIFAQTQKAAKNPPKGPFPLRIPGAEDEVADALILIALVLVMGLALGWTFTTLFGPALGLWPPKGRPKPPAPRPKPVSQPPATPPPTSGPRPRRRDPEPEPPRRVRPRRRWR